MYIGWSILTLFECKPVKINLGTAILKSEYKLVVWLGRTKKKNVISRSQKVRAP